MGNEKETKKEETKPTPPLSWGTILLFAVIGRLAFNYLHIPSVEPIIPFAVLAGFYYGATQGFLVGALGYFFSNILLFSLGAWAFFQALAGGIAGYLVAGTSKNAYVGTVLIGTVIFEAIMNFWGAGFIISTGYYIESFPFTLTHIASNAAFAVLFRNFWIKNEEKTG